MTMVRLAFLLAVMASNLSSIVTAWVSSPGSVTPQTRSFTSSARFMTSTFSSSSRKQNSHDDNDSENDNSRKSNPQPPMRRRAAIDGVSLAPEGFFVLMKTEGGYMPWQVTNDPMDAHAATSAESLTMIQLLSGVDMAGAILPPDLLAKMIVLYCEQLVKHSESDNMDDLPLAQAILEFVRESLPSDIEYFSQAHEWHQSRVKLPQASVDEVLIVSTEVENKFRLTCTIRDFGSLTFEPTEEMLQAVLYQYSPETSLAFTSLALALRYQAPITILAENSDINMENVNDVEETDSPTVQKTDDSTPSYKQLQQERDFLEQKTAQWLETMEEVHDQFPLYRARQELQSASHRVSTNIERGFEIHKLTGALRIARERGDHAAAAKIRAKLDELDNHDLQDLPTAPESNLILSSRDDTDDGSDNIGNDNGMDSVLQ